MWAAGLGHDTPAQICCGHRLKIALEGLPNCVHPTYAAYKPLRRSAATVLSKLFSKKTDLQIAAKQNYSVAGGRNYHKVVPEELDYQIRRLSHHVSLFKSSVLACGGVAPVSRVRLCCAAVLFTSIILT